MGGLSSENLVFDNAVLSNFARIERLGLLLSVSNGLFVTNEVLEEVCQGQKKHPKLAVIGEFAEAGKLRVASATDLGCLALAAKLQAEKILGLGEISAMVLAKEMGGVFVTDDKQATNRAIRLGIKVPNRQEYRSTIVFIQLLKSKKTITSSEYANIKRDLAGEGYVF